MARGWESKSVESQQDAAATPRAKGPAVTPEQAARKAQRATLMLCQGERAIIETTFRYPGDFMFHAHQSEFAELGWMGLFRAVKSDT